MRILLLLFVSVFTIACVSNDADIGYKDEFNDLSKQEGENEYPKLDSETDLVYQEDCQILDQCTDMQEPIIQMQLFKTNDESYDTSTEHNSKKLIESANEQSLQKPVKSTIQK